jgi:outer membrane lipoprotein-sorting protein
MLVYTMRVAALSIVLAIPVFGQTQPNAAEILRKVADNYAHVSEWDLAGTVTATSIQPAATIVTSLRIAGKGASQRRVEKRVEGIPEGSSTIIADGENLWAYYPKTNQFTKETLSKEPEGVLEYFKAPLLMYRTGLNAGKTARLLRQEPILIGSSRVDCFVVQLAQHTWWIDRKRFVVFRDDQAAALDPTVGGSTTLWTTVKLDEPVSDDLFTFTPPPGARQVEKLEP